VENHVCLSRGVQVADAAWRVVMMIVVGVGDQMQRTGDSRTGRVLGDWVIERSGDIVCGMHRAREDEKRGFLGWPQNQGRTISHWFGPQNR
jgi:hypothetical protein